jgi:hypothetical protein
MQTLKDIAPWVAVGAAALALVLLVLVILSLRQVTRLRRAQTIVLGHHGERDIVAHSADLDAQVRNLREAVEILTDELDDQKRHLDHALTNRAIVRYDAFRDAGGEQSASFALLDRYRSGVVFSAIAARDFARIYVKHVTEGVADRELSPEEVQAVQLAVPKPLAAGEQGAKARRAPLPESRPSAGPSLTASADPAGTDETLEPTAQLPSAAAAAAFEALGEAAAPPAGRGPDLGLPDDFTWEPPQQPQGGSSSRR